MNILLTPMSNLTTSYGAMTRCLSVAIKAKEKGHNPIIAAGKDDVNQKQMKSLGITVLEAPVPIPFGLPRILGKIFAFFISKIEIPSKHPDNALIKGFEQALYLTGATQKRFFKKDILFLKNIIKQYKIDAIYTEFRLSGIIAAKLTGIKCLTSFGKPESTEMGMNNKFAKDVNKVLKELNIETVNSSLDIFHWANNKIVPSCEDFEFFENKKGVIYTGPLIHREHTNPTGEKKYILVYLGLAVFPPKKVVKTCIEAFKDSPYEVIIAARELKDKDIGNIKIRKYVSFEDYFPQTLAFINHGGQNSCMSGVLNGVPQINFPGFINERRFNAKGIENIGSGIFCEKEDFEPGKLKELIKKIEKDSNFLKSTIDMKGKLLALGGSDRVIEIFEDLIKC